MITIGSIFCLKLTNTFVKISVLTMYVVEILLNATNIPKYFDKTRIDVYETLCPQQMLVHKGGKIKNWGGECRDVTPTKSLSQNIRVDVNREVKFL